MLKLTKYYFFIFAIGVFFLKPAISRADSCIRSLSKFSAELKTPQGLKKVDFLWKNYFQNRSIENRNALVEFYMPLVHHFIGPIARRIQFGVERDDLVQVGTLGLIRSIERYDPSASTTFEHFAGFRIQGEALDFFRDLDDLSRGDRKRYKRLTEVQQNFHLENGRGASQAELQTILNDRGYSDRDISKILGAESLAKTFSLEATMQDSEGKDVARYPEALIDIHSDEAVESIDKKEFWENYFKHQGFDWRTSKILFSYFFEGKSQKEISRDFGMSDANISRIMTRAINVLKSFDSERMGELKELLAQ
ncbi:MAG: sigma-70 family RNA polymerase sigma factor [Bdellovibrionota bacterium]